MSTYRLMIMLSVLILVACSEEPQTGKADKPHVWQGQVDVLDEAKKVSEDVNEMLRKQEAALDR
jgi:hypothetical protein